MITMVTMVHTGMNAVTLRLCRFYFFLVELEQHLVVLCNLHTLNNHINYFFIIEYDINEAQAV